jgi:lysophospholipase L1-like esterase
MLRETRHRLAPQILLVILSAVVTGVVAFVAGEIAARILRPIPRHPPDYPWKLDPSIGFEFKPYAFYPEQLNREGFRSEDLPLAKRPDEFRILTVGDSTCFGLLVSREHAWPYILEQVLNQEPEDKKVEVINAGVPGYVSYQALERVKHRGLKYNPDVVIAMVGWNDLHTSSLADWEPNINFARIFAGFNRPYETIAHSRLLALFYVGLARLRQRRILQRSNPRPFNERALELYRSNLEAMREASNSHGAVFALVVWPTLANVTPPPANFERKFLPLSVDEFRELYGRYTQAIRQFARDHPDTVLVDPTEAFNASPLKSDLFLDKAHLSPEGNRLLALEIARVLRERGVLPAPATSSEVRPASGRHSDVRH